MLKKAHIPVALAIAVLLSGVFSAYAGTAPTSSGASDSLAISSGETLSGETSSGVVATAHQIHVEATPASGTFRDVMLITLKADNPKAQIWYVTRADASPGDALRYRKPIRITESTPIYFFAYVDEQSESKIEKEEYIIVSSSGTTASWVTSSLVKTGSVSSGALNSNIAAVLKKPVQKPVVAKPVKKPITPVDSTTASGITATGNTATAGSGTIALASSGKTDSWSTKAVPKETIESLYKEQTPLEGSEIRKLLQDSKTSGFESMDTRTKWAAAAGLVSILIAIGVTRAVRMRKKG